MSIIQAVEFTGTHLKVVEARLHKKTTTVKRADVLEIAGCPDEMISKMLSEKIACKNSGIRLVIPRNVLNLRQIVLPSQDPAEIRRMIDLQVTQYTPHRREDIVYEHLIYDRSAAGDAYVLLVLTHQDIIQRYCAIIKKAGLRIDHITFTSLALTHFYSRQQSSQPSNLLEMLISLDAGDVEICFLRNGRLVFSRSVDFTDSQPEDLGPVLSAVDATIHAYQTENHGASCEKIVFLSPQPAESLAQELRRRYSAVVEQLSPGVEIPEAQQQQGVSFAAVTGAALRPLKERFDLLPRQIKREGWIRKKRRQRLQFAVLSVAVIVCAGASVGVNLHEKMLYFRKLDAEIVSAQKALKDIEQGLEQIHFIDQYLSARVFLPEILAELAQLTPGDIYFDSLRFQEKNSFTVQGMASNSMSVNQLHKNMIDSTRFKEVSLEYARKRSSQNGESTQFQITGRLTTQKADK